MLSKVLDVKCFSTTVWCAEMGPMSTAMAWSKDLLGTQMFIYYLIKLSWWIHEHSWRSGL